MTLIQYYVCMLWKFNVTDA